MDGVVQNSQEQQTDLQSQHVSPHSLTWLVWVMVAVPLLYLLSIGPVVRHYDYTGRPMPNALETFYRPLKFLDFPPLRSFLHWYINKLWCPARPAPVSTATSTNQGPEL